VKLVSWLRGVLSRVVTPVQSATKKISAERLAFGLVLTALLLLPQTLAPPNSATVFGLARVYSGDEPHYLVQLSSAARDHDLDVSNNYAWALSGADDAGDRFRGHPLDRHMAAGVRGRTVIWNDYFNAREWKPSKDGWPTPPRINEKRPPRFRYSTHPDGLVVLLAPVWLLLSN
jgi:hypothetical protein